MTSLLVTMSILVLSAGSQSTFQSDPPMQCSACERWNVEQEPFRIFGNTFYVGVRGLSAILITADEGHILLDGGLPQSAALIDASIRKIGFRTEDVRLIGNSHAHFDHSGGLAALKRASGADVLASRPAARALRTGMPTPDDPQFAYGDGFPAVGNVRVVEDGETVSVGDQEITMHLTPGHTPGGTSWTWRSCEDSRCLDMVYADSLTAVSAPEFRFTDDDSDPSIVDVLRQSIAAVAQLPCDIMVSTHPEFSNLFEKLERRENGGDPDAMLDPDGCRSYADGATAALNKRIETEKSTSRN